METTLNDQAPFEWQELTELFQIRDESAIEAERKADILERINRMADMFGKDYVARRIALAG